MLTSQQIKMKLTFGILCLGFFSAQAFAIEVRNEAERFRLIYDKTRNDDLYRPYGHDFILDITGHMSDGIMDLVDEGEAAVGAPDSEKTQKVTDFLNKYKNSSYFANARVAVGIPLPTFDFDSWKLVPDLRGSYELGASASITETASQTLTFPPPIGTVTLSDPVIQLYAKEDIKYGLNFKWLFGENWWVGTDFYVKQRWDRHDVLTSTLLLADKNAFDLDKPKNITSTLDHNFKFGFDQESGLRWWVGAEEIRLSTLSDRKKEVGKSLNWGDRPLLRANVDYVLDMSVIRLTPFLGAHSRSNYDLGDGAYIGLDFDEDLLGIFSAVMMMDNEYFTLNPQLHLWFLNLDYALKAPTDSSVDGYTNQTIHAANFRLAF